MVGFGLGIRGVRVDRKGFEGRIFELRFGEKRLGLGRWETRGRGRG